MITKRYFIVNVTADQPLSENNTAQWRGEGCGVGMVAGRLLKKIGTLCRNAKAGFVLQTAFVLLCVFFLSNTFRSMKDWYQFIDL